MKKTLFRILTLTFTLCVLLGVVTACDNEDYNGLAYTLIDNGTHYEVSVCASTDTDIVIPSSYKGKPVTSIGDYAFFCCDKVETIVVPDSVTNIGDYAFSDCYALTSITIGNGVTIIGEGAFYKCCSLTSIVLPNSLTILGDEAFYKCSLLTYNEKDGLKYLGNSTNPYLYLAGVNSTCTSILTATIDDNCKIIGYGAFMDCTLLTNIVFSNNVTSIGEYAFLNCDSLTSVVLPNSVTSIKKIAFADCDSLISVTIGNSVEVLGEYAFAYCDSLTSVVLPNSVIDIGEHAFSDCDSLTSVVVPNSVIDIGKYAFSHCPLLSYNEKEGLKYLGNSTNPYLYLAGVNSTSILTATIDNNCRFIDSGAFYGCESLTSVTFNGTVAEWIAIEKGNDWSSYIPATFVQCFDGMANI